MTATILLELQSELKLYQTLLTQTKAVLENYAPQDLLLIRLTDSVSAVEGKIFSLEKDIAAWTHITNKLEWLR